MDALYSDALYLTGSREEAADLVVEAYLRTFQEYQQEHQQKYQRAEGGRVPPRRRTRNTRAWLYRSLHGVFCDAILRRAAQDMTPNGGQP